MPCHNNSAKEAYEHYHPIAAQSVTLTEQTLVIMPEVFADLHKGFAPAQLAHWWLSWENAFHLTRPLADPAFQAEFFGNETSCTSYKPFAHMFIYARKV